MNSRVIKIFLPIALLGLAIPMLVFGNSQLLQQMGGYPAPQATAEPAGPKKVIGYLPFWQQDEGFQVIQEHASVFTDISPFWYTLDESGALISYSEETDNPEVISFLRSRGIRIIPTLANIYRQVWRPEVVRKILQDPDISAFHIDNIVSLTETHGYDGIDIDYEALEQRDRDAFSDFIIRLASALHAKGKLLSVTAYAKTSEPGRSEGSKAQNWEVLGQHADQVRVMIYDYHWSSSAAGPIAPIGWVEEVTAFAVTSIPAEKLTLGFGLYGYDWVDTDGETVTWREAIKRAKMNQSDINWDSKSMSPWFDYQDTRGNRHIVWFENAASIEAKLSVARKYKIEGIHFWHLGGEDPGVWDSFQGKSSIFFPLIWATSDSASARRRQSRRS